jgi:hypothetical protein
MTTGLDVAVGVAVASTSTSSQTALCGVFWAVLPTQQCPLVCLSRGAADVPTETYGDRR